LKRPLGRLKGWVRSAMLSAAESRGAGKLV
jgi:hypothetical protein